MYYSMRLSSKCNMNCRFCHIARLKPRDISYIEAKKQIKKILSKNKNKNIFVEFTGGEPTLCKYLPYLINELKVIPNITSSLQTNALLFSNDKYCNNMQNLDQAMVSIHSHKPQTSDYLTRTPNGFNLKNKGIFNLIKMNTKVILSIVINKYNYYHLLDFAKHMINIFPDIDGFLFALMFGDQNYNKDMAVPYSLFIEEMNLTFDFIKKKGKILKTCGIPYCFMSGHEEAYFFGQLIPGRQMIKSDICKRCIYSTRCAGIPQEYADYFGVEEIEKLHKINNHGFEKIKNREFEYSLYNNTKKRNEYVKVKKIE